MLGDGDIKDVPKQLIEIANAGGGHDNITGVVLRVGEGGTSTAAAPRTGEASLKLDALKGMQMFRYLSYRELVRVTNVTA
jgi:serine/threonine protein phosphatase PrpC